MYKDEEGLPAERKRIRRRHNGRNKESTGIRQVAQAARVSTATVSRVLNTPESVGREVKQRVLNAVTELRYVPDSAGRALSLQRSYTIGIVIPTIQNSIFAAQVDALQTCASRHGYNVVVAISGFDLDSESERAANLVRNGAEALMLVGGWHRSELYELLKARGIFYVNTSVYQPRLRHPSIGFDNCDAMERATRYLLDLGHTRFAMLAGRQVGNDRATYRVKGVRRALQEADLAFGRGRLRECDYGILRAREQFRRIMKLRDPPTAIICGNDVLAYGALLQAQHMGISVPQTVSVVGFDDLEWAEQIVPSLTTVRVPWGDMATLAGEYLIGRLNGKACTRATRLQVELVARESSGPPPAVLSTGL